MRYYFVLAALAASLPASALATSGYRCAPVSGRGPVLHLVIGHGVAPQIVAARLDDGSRRFETQGAGEAPPTLALMQGWIDDQRLWLDLADANAQEWQGRLRATFQPRLRGRPAIGTFTRSGRTHRVRCVES